MDNPPIDLLLEALLFVAEGPLGIDDLARALECREDEAEEGLAALAERLAGRGVRLARNGRRVQLVSAPEAAAAVERLLGQEAAGRLSSAALETLAVIAYRQPITRAQVEAIRGVNSDGVIRTLQSRGLIAPQGRLEQAGRPEVLGTTIDFLIYFGLSSLADLPDLPALPEPGDPPATGRPAPRNGRRKGQDARD